VAVVCKAVIQVAVVLEPEKTVMAKITNFGQKLPRDGHLGIPKLERF